MKLSSFKNLINAMPLKNHSFTIKKENWLNINQQILINEVFKNKNLITINRGELLKGFNDLDEFVIKILMWGYPTFGRGNNIYNLLEPNNFKNLIDLLKTYYGKDIKAEHLSRDMQKIKGLGLSTMSKFLYFMGLTVNGKKALILDRRIIEILQLNTFDELVDINYVNYPASVKNYIHYLDLMNKFSKENDLLSENVEMFIFLLGKNISYIDGFKEIRREKVPLNYKDFLIETVNSLIVFEQNLFTSTINLVMQGEMSDLNDTLKVGDTYNFNFEDISASNDGNVLKINEILIILQSTIENLKNINDISHEIIIVE